MKVAIRKGNTIRSYYQFPKDQLFYERNPHPSIEEMICISREVGVSYIRVYYRFSELRLKNGDVCSRDDSCVRVFKFLNCSETLNGQITKRCLKIMHEEFEFVGRIRNLPVESLHLIMQQVRLPEITVMQQFEIWKNETSGQDLDPIFWRNESIDVDFDKEPFERLHFPHLELKKSCSNANEITIQSEEDQLESDKKTLDLLDKSPCQFPSDLEYFNKNRHPTIDEMIKISKEINYPYDTIIKRFFELRMVIREKCTINDPCRKIFQFLNGKEDVLLDRNNERHLDHEFSKLRKNELITGQFHLIMDKVCLPSHIIRKKYGEWFKKRKIESKTDRKLHGKFSKTGLVQKIGLIW